MSNYTEVPSLGVQKSHGKYTLTVENIKCSGCTNSIKSALNEFELSDVNVDHEVGTISFNEFSDQNLLLKVLNRLRGLGYPLVDTEQGLKAFSLKIKSYKSCALGKMK